MGVGEDDVIESFRIDGERFVVAVGEFRGTLEDAAIDQETFAGGFYEIFGAGYGACGAEESEFGHRGVIVPKRPAQPMRGNSESAKEKISKRKAEEKGRKNLTRRPQRRKSTTNDYILPRWGAAVLRPYREIPHRHECTCCWLVGGRGGCLWLINDLADFES